jgi:thiol:disulfide interchange protein DsbD
MRLFLITLLAVQSLWAQNPVTWSAQARQTDTNTYDVVLRATIQDNWKLYSTQLPEGGPLPTVLHWNNASPIGALAGTEPKTGFDAIFEMDLAYYIDEVV